MSFFFQGSFYKDMYDFEWVRTFMYLKFGEISRRACNSSDLAKTCDAHIIFWLLNLSCLLFGVNIGEDNRRLYATVTVKGSGAHWRTLLTFSKGSPFALVGPFEI